MPCGALTFIIETERYGSSKNQQRWTEGEKSPLETVLSEMVKFICDHFIAAQKRREAEAIEQEKRRVESEIRWKKHQEEEALKKQEEARQSHVKALESLVQHRKDDLAKAAEWWRLHQSVMDFLAECERRWQESQAGVLTKDQQEWLVWAKETAKGRSPFESGYPEPLVDGAFDPEAIPFGGPYPETRKFSTPPTMPTVPAPVVVQQSYGMPSCQAPAPKPYPFWLKHQRR